MVVCHVVHDEYSGGRVSLYTTNIMVVVCHVLHDEYSRCRVSCCTRRV